VTEATPEREAKARLIMELRGEGIIDLRVLNVIENIPRDRFVPEAFREHAWDNTSLPIRQGQTISQPYVVALMTQALSLTDRSKVLEIGTGSGYQTAVLSRLCRRVYTVERFRTLHKEAVQLFDALGLKNVTAKVGDGHKGWAEQAPFDRIIVTAAPPEIPKALTDQLADGGILVVPVGRDTMDQSLLRITRKGSELQQENLLPVRFVPLVEGLPKEG
jgi:protein-L-isoaspartate(D-aspartate) O-methyltransferase